MIEKIDTIGCFTLLVAAYTALFGAASEGADAAPGVAVTTYYVGVVAAAAEILMVWAVGRCPIVRLRPGKEGGWEAITLTRPRGMVFSAEDREGAVGEVRKFFRSNRKFFLFYFVEKSL